MNQARDTAAARIAASIDARLEEVDGSPGGNPDLIEDVVRLAEALDIVDRGALPEIIPDDIVPAVEGLWGDYAWALSHGAETVALTWSGAGGAISDQVSPFEAVLFARSIEAQAYAVLGIPQ